MTVNILDFIGVANPSFTYTNRNNIYINLYIKIKLFPSATGLVQKSAFSESHMIPMPFRRPTAKNDSKNRKYTITKKINSLNAVSQQISKSLIVRNPTDTVSFSE